MIRFVDVTDAYWTDGGPPLCMFVDTITNRCVEALDGGHVFDSLADVRALPEVGERCARLVPDGFFVGPAR